LLDSIIIIINVVLGLIKMLDEECLQYLKASSFSRTILSVLMRSELAQFKITRETDAVNRDGAEEYVIIPGIIDDNDMSVAIEGLKRIGILGELSCVPGTPPVYFLVREHVGRKNPQRDEGYRADLIDRLMAI